MSSSAGESVADTAAAHRTDIPDSPDSPEPSNPSEHPAGSDSATAALINSYSRYVPGLILDKLAARARAVEEPSLELFDCAVLFADISGFTPLTEKFAAQGPAGAETLTRILNTYFGRLIEIIREHGGDVVKFAGDAMTIIWRPDTDHDMSDIAHRAAQCALEVQRSVENYEAHGHKLSLKVAVGIGTCSIVHIGGQFNRWEFAIAGEPLNQVGHAGDYAEPGDVVISDALWQLINDKAKGRQRAENELKGLTWLDDVEPLTPSGTPQFATVDHSLEGALRGYLPAAVTRRIMAGQTDFLGELRTLTILFINLPDLNYDTPLESAQAAMHSLQKALYFPHEGSINKLSVDDKGVSLIAATGLPPFSHEDDPVRGTLAALAMHKALKDLDLRCSIGVTTGRVYCGSVGSNVRQEYTIMGDKVNLSARLMQRAEGGVLVDEATWRRAQHVVEFDDGTAISVKGKSEAQTVFVPIGPRASKDSAITSEQVSAGSKLVGRKAELATFSQALAAVVDHGTNQILLIEGEAGIGKSRLLHAMLGKAQETPLKVLTGAADAVEQSTSYYAWQSILFQHLGLDRFENDDARRTHIEEIVSKDRSIKPLTPLLKTFLSLDIEESDLTRQMAGEMRANNTQRLVSALLQFSAARQPLLIVIDDVHWLDSSSWSLLSHIATSVSPLMLVILHRPMDNNVPRELNQLRRNEHTHALLLERMSPEESVELVASRLGANGLPEAVAEFIRERAEGHPFFAEEIGLALRDNQLMTIDSDGNTALAEGVSNLDQLDLPGTVEGMITSRIDRLSPEQQLTIKVASVIGRVFSYQLLKDIFPVDDTRDALHNDLSLLENLDLTPVESPDPQLSYIFKHIITQQVAYDLMLFSQRKELHEAVARWYESHDTTDQSAHYPMLAHHWGRAENYEQAVHYLQRSAEVAVRANANQEAIGFIEQVEGLADLLDEPPDVERRAHWCQLKAEALRSMGRLEEAKQSFIAALDLLGVSFPTSDRAVVTSLLKELLTQIKHRWMGSGKRQYSDSEKRRVMMAADIVERLFLIYFFDASTERMVYCGLWVINQTERIGEVSGPLVRGYVSFAVALAAIPMHKAMDRYIQRATDALEQVDDNLQVKAWANLGATAAIGAVGRWDDIEMKSIEALSIYQRLGDHRGWEETAGNVSLIRTIYGRIDRPEESLYAELLESGKRRESIQVYGWGLSLTRMNYHYLQRVDQLDEALDENEALYRSGQLKDPITLQEFIGLLAQRAVRRNDTDQAVEFIEAGLASLKALGRPSQYRNLPAAQILTEAIIEWWQQNRDDGDAAGQQSRAAYLKEALAYMKTYAGIFPIGRSKITWLEGKVAFYEGHLDKAIKLWNASIDHARQWHLSYDELLVHETLALHDPTPAGAEIARELAAGLREELLLGVPLEVPGRPDDAICAP